MGQYQFLSDEWLEQTRKIRAEFEGRVQAVPVTVGMNQIINEVPFGSGTIHAHVDTSSGQLEIETGHLESPDLTVTLAYATAKAILVDADGAAAMNAFFSGRIKVDGDVTKLIALLTAGSGPTPPGAAETSAETSAQAAELMSRLQAMTL